MKKSNSRITSRVQRNWDWRAAANFIGGGVGSGLIFWSVLLSPLGYDSLLLMLLGLALVGAGLFCVWLEIGRPWRALNVFKHMSTSWMSREAMVAPLLFTAGAASWLFEPMLAWPTALLAILFLYTQSRILLADKGIPAWRHPRCAQLVITTGMTEGCGLLLLALPLIDTHQPWSWAVMLILLGLRALAWRHYRAGLKQTSAPPACQKKFAAINPQFLWLGHIVPVILLALAFIQAEAAMLAGILAFGSGAWMKYILICKASFIQGFNMPHLPVRGQPTPSRTVSAT
ncbi:MAG: DmsC/YnfH family molybdoenzyme membrane anchor subunit [Halopseudomonas sp.]